MPAAKQTEKRSVATDHERGLEAQRIKNLFIELPSLKTKISKISNQKTRSAGEISLLAQLWQDLQKKLRAAETALAENAEPALFLDDQKTLAMMHKFVDSKQHKIASILNTPPTKTEIPAVTVDKASSDGLLATDGSDQTSSVRSEPVSWMTSTTELSESSKSLSTASTRSGEPNQKSSPKTTQKVTIVELEALDSEQSWFDRVAVETNRAQQQEIARHALLWLFTEKSDKTQINGSLSYLLPYAYPKYFAQKDGHLRAVGPYAEDFSRLFKSDGDGIIVDCQLLDDAAMDEMAIKMRENKELMLILKLCRAMVRQQTQACTVDHLTPIIDTCVELISVLSNKSLVSIGKAQAVMQMIGFAAGFARNAASDQQVLRVSHLLEQPFAHDTPATVKFKSWLADKLQNSPQLQLSLPTALIQDWRPAPPMIARYLQAMDSWRDVACGQLNSPQDSVQYPPALLKKERELVYQLHELFTINAKLVWHMYEAKEIICSRLQDAALYGLSIEDQQQLRQYAVDAETFCAKYEAWLQAFPAPTAQQNVRDIIKQLPDMIESPLFRNFLSVKENLKVYDFFSRIDAQYHGLLCTRSAVNGGDLEQRFGRQLETYADTVKESFAKLHLHVNSIEKTMVAASQAANKQTIGMKIYLPTFLSKLSTAFAIIHQQGLGQNIALAPYAGEQRAEQELSKHNNPQQAALLALMAVYADSEKNASHKSIGSQAYLSAYLKKILPVAFPTRFASKDGVLCVLPEADNALITAALGPDLTLPSAFDSVKLLALAQQFPQESQVWSYLLSLKPVDTTFSLDDKLSACMQVLYAISQKKLVTSAKFENALQLIYYAVQESKPYQPCYLLSTHVTAPSQNSVQLRVVGDHIQYRVMDACYQMQEATVSMQALDIPKKDIKMLCALQAAAAIAADPAGHGVTDEFLQKYLQFTPAKLADLRAQNNQKIPLTEILNRAYFTSAQLKEAQNVGADYDQLMMTYLDLYFAKILAISHKNGHTFDKPLTAIGEIQALFADSPLQNPQQEEIRGWLRREYALKHPEIATHVRTVIDDLCQGQEHVSNKQLPPAATAQNPFMAFFSYISQIITHWIYDLTAPAPVHKSHVPPEPTKHAQSSASKEQASDSDLGHSSDWYMLKVLNFSKRTASTGSVLSQKSKRNTAQDIDEQDLQNNPAVPKPRAAEDYNKQGDR